MDKNAIKKYAIWARNELIARVAQKATKYGVLEKNSAPKEADSINGRLLSTVEKKQRQALLAKIEENGYENTIEEVAYTWFNRFIALRFMEVNSYLPTHIRVFTNADNAFCPEIMDEATNLEFEGLNIEKVYNYKENNEDEELFRYLLILQCNALNKILPVMFQKLEDYTELLLPDNLLREGSVIEKLVSEIPEEDWQDQVQIIGWLYQYYNTEPKDKVFANLKKNIKISKENIPAATQLFTPDWIVRYMVENSLGRLWVEGHPNDDLKANWKYYLEEAKQEPEVQAQLAEIRKEYAQLQPEDLLCIDPCQGSGHILCYMFDVLMQIYEAYGYTSKEAVKNIVEKNIWGLDIDERASQLAYFSVMMKARQYDRRFFSHIVQPNVFAIEESNGIDKNLLQYFGYGMDEQSKNDAKTQLAGLLEQMHDAKEYGSIINIDACDWVLLKEFVSEYDAGEVGLFDALNLYEVQKKLQNLVCVAQALGQKYHTVITNPPYMNSSGMTSSLAEYIKVNYSKSKSDLSTVFMEKAVDFCSKSGMFAMINIPVWMTLTSFEALRKHLLNNNYIVNMLHCGRGIFGSDFGTTAFVFRKNVLIKYIGAYIKLFDKPGDVENVSVKEKRLFERPFIYNSNTDNYYKIPGSPIAYWASESTIHSFLCKKVVDYAYPIEGIKSGDNEKFLRFFHEVDSNKIAKLNDFKENFHKWCFTTKGGAYRKWYGNIEYVIDWTDNGKMLKNTKGTSIYKIDYWYLPAITWTYLTAGSVSFRVLGDGYLYNNKGPAVFGNDKNILKYVSAILNSKVGSHFLSFICSTLTFLPGDIKKIPVIKQQEDYVVKLVDECVALSELDWDFFETSWDFKRHPLAFSAYERKEQLDAGIHSEERRKSVTLISDRFSRWMHSVNNQFVHLKANEEELNRIFIDIYGLQDELTPEVEEKDVTIHNIFDSKEDVPESMKNSNYVLTKQDVIKSFISYAVGCMFGRYSLDVEGLAYAGGDWNEAIGTTPDGKKVGAHDNRQGGKYQTYPVDSDNIIPICDDEYFDDDIVGRFVDFVKVVYGEETLEENLKFIADALEGKGSPRTVIRNYFLNGFYADHCKIYQKRPIYWLFDSGKKNGFKCLIYMHRYQPDTIARIRTDYVHEQQARYNTAMEDLLKRIDGASASERAKLGKHLSAFQAKDAELREYEEKIHYLADRMIKIDLDDGVKHNYELFKDVLAKIK